MNFKSATVYEQLDQRNAALVDAICDRFEEAWKRASGGDEPPAIQSFLASQPESVQSVLASELAALDRAYRERRGEHPAPEQCSEFLVPKVAAANPSHSASAQVAAPGLPSGGNWPELPGLQIVKVLGEGGMGIVYKAWQPALDRYVAVKMLRRTDLGHAEHRERFAREARAVAQLQHPHMVQIFAIGELPGADAPLPYFVMEYVAGGNLADVLRGQPQAPRWAAQLIETLARALHYAHQQGVVHRDLKPGNVLVQSARGLGKHDQTGDSASLNSTAIQPKVSDFGLAKLGVGSDLTQTGDTLGTPSYMAPEQTEGKSAQVGPLTDVYGLGAIFYETLTGRPPFQAETSLATVLQVRQDEPVSPRRLQPTVPIDLETICLKCLQKVPGQRYASAAALASDLGCFLDGRPIEARPVGRAERVRRWCRRKPLVAGLLAALLFALVGGSAGVISQWQRAERNTDDFKRERDTAIQERERAEHHLKRARAAADELARLGNELCEQPQLNKTGRALLEKVLAFYEEMLREESSDPAVRFETAQLYAQVASIRYTLGQWEAALTARRQQCELLEGLVAESPAKTQYRLALAVSFRECANILRDRGKKREALDTYRQAVALHEQTLGDPGADALYRVALANAFMNIATVLSPTEDAKEIEALYSRAIDLNKTALAADPNNLRYQRELALILEGQAMVYWKGQGPQAERAIREALKIRQQQFDNGQLPRVQEPYLARIYINLANILVASDRLPEAEKLTRQAIDLLDKLVNDFPAGLRYRFLLAETLISLGKLLSDPSRREELEEITRQTIAHREKLASDLPEEPSYRRDLADTLMQWRGYLSAPDQKSELEQVTRRSIGLYEQLVVEFSKEARFAEDLDHCHSCLQTLRREISWQP